METISKVLAEFFDKLKVNNPVMYVMIIALLLGANALFTEFLDMGYFEGIWKSIIKVLNQGILLFLGILGTRTYKYIHDETDIQQ
jgi:vacuolar-type H+-ATPase subunit I/STV1